jgi:hypothetical protein
MERLLLSIYLSMSNYFDRYDKTQETTSRRLYSNNIPLLSDPYAIGCFTLKHWL